MDITNYIKDDTEYIEDDTDYSDMPELISFSDLQIDDRNELGSRYMFKSISSTDLLSYDDLEPLSKKRCLSAPSLDYDYDNDNNYDNYNKISIDDKKNNIDFSNNYYNVNNKYIKVNDHKYYENNHKIEYYENLVLSSNKDFFYYQEKLLSKCEKIKILEELCITSRKSNSECPVNYCKCKR